MQFHHEQEAVAQRLRERLGLIASSFRRIDNAYNNIVYIVDIDPPQSTPSGAIGTSPIPASARRVVTRENINPDPAVALRNESEIAAMYLARQSGVPVPEVYDWCILKTEREFGWIVMEYVEGEDIIDLYQRSEEPEQRIMLDQLVHLAVQVQNVELPAGIQHGGFRFQDGTVASAASPFPCGGPFSSVADYLQAWLDSNWGRAKESSRLRGWEDLRPRIGNFVSGKLVETMRTIREANPKPTFVHGDLHGKNVLYRDGHIVALLDWEWAHTSSPIDEYYYSFDDWEASYMGPFRPDTQIADVVFHAETSGGPRDLVMFNEALRASALHRLDAVPAAKEMACVYWFAYDLAPWNLDHPKELERMGDEGIVEFISATRKRIEQYLDMWGV